MDQPTDRAGREPITVGRADSPRAIVLFHGYTGSTRDFNDLPEHLAKELDAYVYVPLLPGHGATIDELLPLNFDAFMQAADAAVARVARDGRHIAFGGHSFGAYLALLCADKYENAAVFTSVIPYELRFPYSSIVGRTLSRSKKLWTKHLPQEEWEARRGVFFYPQMPGKALSLVHEGKRRVTKTAISSPMFNAHAENDTLAHARSSVEMLRKLAASSHDSLVVENGRHSIFFSPQDKERVMSAIGDFLGRSFAEHE